MSSGARYQIVTTVPLSLNGRRGARNILQAKASSILGMLNNLHFRSALHQSKPIPSMHISLDYIQTLQGHACNPFHGHGALSFDRGRGG